MTLVEPYEMENERREQRLIYERERHDSSPSQQPNPKITVGDTFRYNLDPVPSSAIAEAAGREGNRRERRPNYHQAGTEPDSHISGKPAFDRRVDLQCSNGKSCTASSLESIFEASQHVTNVLGSPLLSLPVGVRRRLMHLLFEGDDNKVIVSLSPESATRAVFPDHFLKLSELLHPLEGARLTCRQLNNDVLGYLCSTFRFHVTLSSWTVRHNSPLSAILLDHYVDRIQYLAIEVNLTELGLGCDPYSHTLQSPIVTISNGLERVVRMLAKRKAPLKELHVLCRRYAGLRNDNSPISIMESGLNAEGPRNKKGLWNPARRPWSPNKLLRVFDVICHLTGKVDSLRLSGMSQEYTRLLMKAFFGGEPGITYPFRKLTQPAWPHIVAVDQDNSRARDNLISPNNPAHLTSTRLPEIDAIAWRENTIFIEGETPVSLSHVLTILKAAKEQHPIPSTLAMDSAGTMGFMPITKRQYASRVGGGLGIQVVAGGVVEAQQRRAKNSVNSEDNDIPPLPPLPDFVTKICIGREGVDNRSNRVSDPKGNPRTRGSTDSRETIAVKCGERADAPSNPSSLTHVHNAADFENRTASSVTGPQDRHSALFRGGRPILAARFDNLDGLQIADYPSNNTTAGHKSTHAINVLGTAISSAYTPCLGNDRSPSFSGWDANGKYTPDTVAQGTPKTAVNVKLLEEVRAECERVAQEKKNQKEKDLPAAARKRELQDKNEVTQVAQLPPIFTGEASTFTMENDSGARNVSGLEPPRTHVNLPTVSNQEGFPPNPTIPFPNFDAQAFGQTRYTFYQEESKSQNVNQRQGQRAHRRPADGDRNHLASDSQSQRRPTNANARSKGRPLRKDSTDVFGADLRRATSGADSRYNIMPKEYPPPLPGPRGPGYGRANTNQPVRQFQPNQRSRPFTPVLQPSITPSHKEKLDRPEISTTSINVYPQDSPALQATSRFILELEEAQQVEAKSNIAGTQADDNHKDKPASPWSFESSLVTYTAINAKNEENQKQAAYQRTIATLAQERHGNVKITKKPSALGLLSKFRSTSVAGQDDDINPHVAARRRFPGLFSSLTKSKDKRPSAPSVSTCVLQIETAEPREEWPRQYHELTAEMEVDSIPSGASPLQNCRIAQNERPVTLFPGANFTSNSLSSQQCDTLPSIPAVHPCTPNDLQLCPNTPEENVVVHSPKSVHSQVSELISDDSRTSTMTDIYNASERGMALGRELMVRNGRPASQSFGSQDTYNASPGQPPQQISELTVTYHNSPPLSECDHDHEHGHGVNVYLTSPVREIRDSFEIFSQYEEPRPSTKRTPTSAGAAEAIDTRTMASMESDKEEAKKKRISHKGLGARLMRSLLGDPAIDAEHKKKFAAYEKDQK